MGNPVHLLAQPGDEDLDIDINGMRITAVVYDHADSREVLVSGSGGYGRWFSTAECRIVDVVDAEEISFQLYAPDAPDAMWDEMLRRIERWRDLETPLHLCGAPGKLFALIETPTMWIPLPRREHPDWVV